MTAEQVVAVWCPELALLFYTAAGLDAAAERLAPQAQRYAAQALSVAPGAAGGLRVTVQYAPAQASLAYPPGVTHCVTEQYEIYGAALVMRAVQMEFAGCPSRNR